MTGTVPDTVAIGGSGDAHRGCRDIRVGDGDVTDAEVAVLPAASRALRSARGCRFGRGGVPRHAVGRAGVLGAQQDAVHRELHPGHPDIVGGGGGDGDRARDGCAAAGAVISPWVPWYPHRGYGPIVGSAVSPSSPAQRSRRRRDVGGVDSHRRRQLHGRCVGKGLLVTLITNGRQITGDHRVGGLAGLCGGRRRRQFLAGQGLSGLALRTTRAPPTWPANRPGRPGDRWATGPDPPTPAYRRPRSTPVWSSRSGLPSEPWRRPTMSWQNDRSGLRHRRAAVTAVTACCAVCDSPRHERPAGGQPVRCRLVTVLHSPQST